MTVDVRRGLPSVDALLRSEPGRRAVANFGRPIVKGMLTQTLDEARAAAERGVDPPSEDDILAHAVGLVSRIATGLTPVINATWEGPRCRRQRRAPPPEPRGPTRTWRSIAKRASAASDPPAPRPC